MPPYRQVGSAFDPAVDRKVLDRLPDDGSEHLREVFLRKSRSGGKLGKREPLGRMLADVIGRLANSGLQSERSVRMMRLLPAIAAQQQNHELLQHKPGFIQCTVFC